MAHEMATTGHFRPALLAFRGEEPAGVVLLADFGNTDEKRRNWFIAMGYIPHVGADRAMLVSDAWFRPDATRDEVRRADKHGVRADPKRREAIIAVSYAAGSDVDLRLWPYRRKDMPTGMGRSGTAIIWQPELDWSEATAGPAESWMADALRMMVHAERKPDDELPDEIRDELLAMEAWIPEMMAAAGFTVISPTGVVLG